MLRFMGLHWRNRRGAAAAGSGGRAARGCGSVPPGCPRSQTGLHTPGRTSSPGVEGVRVRGGWPTCLPCEMGRSAATPAQEWPARSADKPRVGGGSPHLLWGPWGTQLGRERGRGGRRGVWRHGPLSARCCAPPGRLPGPQPGPRAGLPPLQGPSARPPAHLLKDAVVPHFAGGLIPHDQNLQGEKHAAQGSLILGRR